MKIKRLILLIILILQVFLISSCKKTEISNEELQIADTEEGNDQSNIIQLLEYFETLHYEDYACTLISDNNCIDVFWGNGDCFIWSESCLPGLKYQSVIETQYFDPDENISIAINGITINYLLVDQFNHCIFENHIIKNKNNSIITNYGKKCDQLFIIYESSAYLYEQIQK